jgi:hypothetical protein
LRHLFHHLGANSPALRFGVNDHDVEEVVPSWVVPDL